MPLLRSKYTLYPVARVGRCSFISRAQLRLLVINAAASSNLMLRLSSSAAATHGRAGRPRSGMSV